MYHRRLLLLFALMFIGVIILTIQLYRLTIVHGQENRRLAELVLSSKQLIDTTRGSIYDRKGRKLTTDIPSCDIRVHYDVITGQWAYFHARRAAARDDPAAWRKMSFDQREARIARYRTEFDNELEKFWNRLATVSGTARDEIERRKSAIIRRVRAIRTDVWIRQDQRARQEQDNNNNTQSPAKRKQTAPRVAEEDNTHVVLSQISDNAKFAFKNILNKRSKDDLSPTFIVDESTRARIYPLLKQTIELDLSTFTSPLRQNKTVKVTIDNVGSQVLGSMREVWAEDVAKLPFRKKDGQTNLQGYLDGDYHGVGGIEQSQEARLRGTRGRRVISRRTKKQIRFIPPTPGNDVHLTLDIQLQARIRAILDPQFGLTRVQTYHQNKEMKPGTSLNAAAVVLDVDTGDVLAMVSTPVAPQPIPGQKVPKHRYHSDRPDINRVVSAVYHPGSTLKPIVYCIAARQFNVAFDQKIECKGHLIPNNTKQLRCWGYRPKEGKFLAHGPLHAIDAIARSCNIFFYQCGRNLGAEPLIADLRMWGFGPRPNRPGDDPPPRLGLPNETDGLMPRIGTENPTQKDLTLLNATLMGIGQGPISVPPIQVATAHATLARGGYYLSPILIKNRKHLQHARDLQLPPPAVERALKGMHDSTYKVYGSANRIPNLPPTPTSPRGEPIITHPNLIVRSKTGTAQTSPQRALIQDKKGRIVPKGRTLRKGPHSWFVSHVQLKGENRARYIIAVIVEHGGSGGRVAGPIVNQIIYALQKENYLHPNPYPKLATR